MFRGHGVGEECGFEDTRYPVKVVLRRRLEVPLELFIILVDLGITLKKVHLIPAS